MLDIHELTPQQMRFVTEYVSDPSNAAAAAKRAGYSVDTAKEAASRLLQTIKIKKAISQAQAHAVKALNITAERVLQELALIAFARNDDIITTDENGETDINLHGLSVQNKNSPTEVSVSTSSSKSGKVKTVTVKGVKLSDKQAALERLGKHLGMFKEQIEVSATHSLVDLVEQSMKLVQPTLPQISLQPNEDQERLAPNVTAVSV